MIATANAIRTSAPRALPARVAAGALFAAAASYLVSEAAAAWAYSPSYSYARNYISDLGVPTCGAAFAGRLICSPLHAVVDADFILQGILFLVAAIDATRLVSSRARYALLACAILNGIGISLVGLYPETDTSGVHSLGALLSIVFGNATALASAFAFRELDLPRLHRLASLALPILAAVAFTTLLVARAHATTILVPDGIWERISVYTITAWELVTAYCLARVRRRRPNGAMTP